MSSDSEIEWTDNTFNAWWGCARTSPACRNCYAERLATRFGGSLWGPNSPRRIAPEHVWATPLRWNEQAALTGKKQRVFSLSMGDLFEARTELDAPRARLWKLIEATPNLTWQLLTKRPQNIASMVPWSEEWPSNVWLGTTAESQLFAEQRIPRILEHHARIHFVSCEPLLGPLALAQFMRGERRIGWLVAGGESGPAARPTLPQWFRALRDECVRHDVKFFLKQVGRWAPNADGQLVKLRSKKDAGRLLDGREWNEVPDGTPTALSVDGALEGPAPGGRVGLNNSPTAHGIRT